MWHSQPWPENCARTAVEDEGTLGVCVNNNLGPSLKISQELSEIPAIDKFYGAISKQCQIISGNHMCDHRKLNNLAWISFKVSFITELTQATQPFKQVIPARETRWREGGQ